MNRITLVKFIFLLSFLMMSSFSEASVAVKTDANTRLRVPVARDSMNRIAFANDRIAQVFGDEEAYTLQSDETRGQIFLKPTEANGDKPISITLTTEQNVVQDMELTPQKIPTATIILKGEGKNHSKGDNSMFPSHASVSGNQFGLDQVGFMGRGQSTPYLGWSPSHATMNYANPSTDRIGHLVRLIKGAASQMILQNPDSLGKGLRGDGSDAEEDKPIPMTVAGLSVEGIRMICEQGTSISIYTLKNITETDLEVVENAFGGGAVLAVSVEKRQLKPQEITSLFVLRSLSS